MVNAHHVPVGGGGGGGVLNVLAGNRLPAGPVKMRLGWSQSRVFVAGTFTRAETHPTDGAAEGFSSGLIVPPFPPALATDTSLYLGVWIAGTEELIAIDRSGVDSLSAFPVADKISIQVDGINGHYYPASAREAAPTTDNILSVVIPGDTVFTSANVSDWAKSSNTDLIPAAKLPAGGGLVEIISKTNLHVSRNNPANLAYLRSGWRDYKLLGLAISHQEFESFDFDIWRANTIGESVQMYWISPADIQDQATYTSGGSTESTAVLINLDPGMHIIGLNTSTDRIKFALNQIRIAEDNAGRLVLFGQQYAREVEHQDGGNILFGGTETKSNLGTIQVQLWGMN